MNDLLEPVLRDTLQKRAAQLDPGARDRVLDVDYRPRTRRLRLLPALGAAGLAGAAAALVLIFTLGSNPAPASAFAGWSATPTVARPGQTARAITWCRLGHPVIVDTRGPFTVALFPHARLKPPPGLPTVTPAMPPPPKNKSLGTCFYAPTVSSAGTSVSQLGPVRAGQIHVVAQSVSGGSESATVLDGRAGAGVSGVRIRLSDGKLVTATVVHGWYLVWWPGRPVAVRAEITAGGRRRAYSLPAAVQAGTGSCAGWCASIGPAVTVGG